MFDDAIIEEVRQIRDQLAAQFNYDVKAIGAAIRARQEEKHLSVVSRPPRQPIQEALPQTKPRHLREQDQACAEAAAEMRA